MSEKCIHSWKQHIRVNTGSNNMSGWDCTFYCTKCLAIKHINYKRLEAKQ